MSTTMSLGLPARVPQPGLPTAVRVCEVGPRDGLQAEQQLLPVGVKVELVQRLIAAGLRIVELTSFVNPARVPQMSDAAELMRLVDLDAGVRHPVLVPNQRGLDDALAAGAREVAVFISATESFSQANLGASRAAVGAKTVEVARRAVDHGLTVRGYVSMVFGDPWQGAVPLQDVVDAAVMLREAGASMISLGDTIGVGTPGQVKSLVARLNEAGIEPGRLALHPHDTYGQALANVYAALEAGITEFDSSAGGVGGCPFARSATGNLATEDLVWMLNGLGIETGIDLAALVSTSSWLADQLGRPSPSRVVAALS